MADEENVEEPPPEDEEAPAEPPPESDEPPAEEVMEVSDLVDAPLEQSESSSPPPALEATPGDGDGGSRRNSQQPKRGSTMSDIPLTDSAVLDELKEADAQACKTALLIESMRKSIEKFQKKAHLSEEDAQKLSEKQSELMRKLGEFEDITRRVQRLVGLTDISSSQFQPSFAKLEDVKKASQLSAEHELDKSSMMPEIKEPEAEEEEYDFEPETCLSEDRLPKVIVCGIEDQVPRIIVCETPKRLKPKKRLSDYKNKCGLMESLTGRLSQSYSMQEKLASENADLEGNRYSLQEELYQKDNTVESMQKKICSLQTEMRIMAKENAVLSESLARANQKQQHPQSQAESGPCPKLCPPTCIANKPGYGGSGPQQPQTEHLERQLNLIEQEVKKMQGDISKVQRERQQLDNHKKLLKCTGADCSNKKCPAKALMPARDCEQSLRELKEQYKQLEDDFKSKVTEVSVLRRDIDKQRELAEQAKEDQVAAETLLKVAQEKLDEMDKLSRRMAGSKEQLMEQEQALNVSKQRFRESQDELEELRGLIQDQAAQLEDYRNKYLLAQQQVEEQRRQIEMMDMDNSRISEQVSMEIQRVRNQFQEKLQELTPLPDILKATQLKLQETQQLRMIAERNCEDMAREMQEAKDKARNYARELDDSRATSSLSIEEQGNQKTRLENCERKLKKLGEENDELKTATIRLEEQLAQGQIRLEEKLHEVAQLLSQLETLREESARQVARTKDRCETVRRSYQNQISELERQLAQSRAAAQTAMKDRNEIRQRMQSQINNLNESFEEAQMRIRGLQGNVNFLKTSYSNIFAGDNPTPLMITGAAPNNYGGANNCDCDQY